MIEKKKVLKVSCKIPGTLQDGGHSGGPMHDTPGGRRRGDARSLAESSGRHFFIKVQVEVCVLHALIMHTVLTIYGSLGIVQI